MQTLFYDFLCALENTHVNIIDLRRIVKTSESSNIGEIISNNEDNDEQSDNTEKLSDSSDDNKRAKKKQKKTENEKKQKKDNDDDDKNEKNIKIKKDEPKMVSNFLFCKYFRLYFILLYSNCNILSGM